MKAELLRRLVVDQVVLPFVYCYPPRTSYIAEEAPLDLHQVWSADALVGSDLNIYVHIPFCRYKCSFCNLYTVTASWAEGDLFQTYVAAVVRDLRLLAPSLVGRRVRSVYVGGGTPFTVGINLLVSLLASLAGVFPDLHATVEEITIEATPDSVLAAQDQLASLVAAGVNRVSIGAQSLDDGELSQAGRKRAGSSVILDSIHLLRSSGVSNIDVDLIVGLDAQTEDSLIQSIDTLLKHLPETISVYPISPRRGTRLGQNLASLPTPDQTIVRRLATVSGRLRRAGYSRDTSVQFKLPGNGGFIQKRLYFGGVSVLGLGSGARSYTATVDYLTGGGRPGNRASLANYLQNGGMSASSGVSIVPDEGERRTVILALQDLDPDRLPRAPDGSLKEPYGSVLQTALDLGLFEERDNRLRLTERGYLHRDAICWSLFSDSVLGRHSAHGEEYVDSQRFLSVA